MPAALHDDDSRAPAWVIVAVLLHGAMFAGVMLLPKPHAKVIAAVDPIEVTVVETPPAPAAEIPRPDDTQSPRETTEAVHPAAAAATGAAGFAAPGPSASVLAMNEGPPGADTAPAGSGPGVSLIRPEQLGIAGIGSSNPFLPKKEEIPPQATNEKRREPLRNTGLERDMSLGLGPEGPALTAINESTRTSIAPDQGRATFLVRSNSEGVATAVEVIDANGNTGWLDAAKQTLAALKGKRFRVPSGANGLAMRIEVVSDMQLPNGQRVGSGTARAGDFKMPEIVMPDLSNVGQSPRRVVKSHAVSIEVL